ncbi:MAG: FISUMP domain-containing protein, partial [Bacteroidetes bacterium]|nr:FISUMP domain-containing protein [Bacteroidota bacterium]
DHWNSPNTGATNSSGFTGLPGGYRYSGGVDDFGDYGYWWSASESGSDSWLRELSSYSGAVDRYSNDRYYGFSARCVRD